MTDMLVSSHGHKHGMQINTRKPSTVGLPRDLWLVVREGSLTDVDFTLAQLKKNGGNINSRNTFGLTPLHIAIWRNHIPIVRRLLAAGADPDARDGESGWSSLHRAMHFNHLAVASILLQSGASISLEDSKFRTPVDLLSGPVLLAIGDGKSTATEVFSWGSGANYQLGTGNAHIQKLPCKVDALHGSFIKMVSAAKFHSVAVTSLGEVYTWGFGRGGRLGHPDFDIHSGQAAVITPRQVTSGLGSRRVRVIAAAKHHTVVATEGGEVFTWGSNREGQLGYTMDTQPTPRKVNSLKSRIVAVAAANKHTAVISDAGEVFTWGCNKEGQLGYGTSNSASNYTPRVVEYLKGKKFKGVVVAKCHTMVLGADGEVYTWGHRLVTPKRVVINRNLKKSGSSPLKFHRSERLRVAAIAAGMVHSLALTDDGALFYWVSSDPNLNCQQLYSMCGKSIVSISSGKYWSAAVTETGDVYMWDGKKGKDIPPVLTRLHGVKKATSVSVGETHLLMIGSLYHPAYSTLNANRCQEPTLGVKDDKEELDDHFMFEESESVNVPTNVCKDDLGQRSVPSLKTLCEKVAAENLVEPRNVMQMLEIADTLGADNLRKYCEDIAIRNLDYILTVSSHSFATASPEVLANLEHLLDQRSPEPWSYRRLPTPTVTFPVIINSEEEDSENEILRTRDNYNDISTMKCAGDQRFDSFLQSKDDLNQEISKKVRALRKKLQQVEMLETKQSLGHLLDDQQIAKLQMKVELEKSLVELGVPVETTEKAGTSADVKGSKKAQLSKKQKKKSKHNTDQPVIIPAVSGVGMESGHVKNFSDIKISQASPKKEDDNIGEVRAASQVPKEIGFSVQRRDTDSSDSPKGKTMSPSASKKKNRKGGLSMFLSGALDDAPKEVLPSPPTPKSEGPAWGGAKISLGSSLREIQDEQSKMMVKQPTKGKNLPEDHLDPKSDRKLPLSSFFPSKPIPVISTHTPQPSDTEKSTPTWASGTPPLLSRPSLRDIQMQEEKKQRSICQSPKTRMAGFAVAASPGSPSDSSINRWFKPEVEARSSIRSIQIEEKAIKDLKRFYSSVKVVKNTA